MSKSPLHSNSGDSTTEKLSDGDCKFIRGARSQSAGIHQMSKRHSCDESFVVDVHLHFFYKPHSITAMVAVMSICVYFAFSPEEVGTRTRVWRGIGGACLVFLLCGMIALPSGPFTRPHPAFWRLVLAISILYWLCCTVVLFQNYEDLRVFFGMAFPELKPDRTSGPLPWTKINFLDADTYAQDCTITFDNVYLRFDRFVLAHFLGWFFKAVMLRSFLICMIASAFWEITETFFAGILPNFVECWWDQFLLDLFVFNLIGIVAGITYCKYLEMKKYHWRSFKELPTRREQLKRAVQQFTPASWTRVRWAPLRSVERYLQVCVVIFLNQIIELNAFFLKAVFEIPSTFPFNWLRLFLLAYVCLPSIRQLYVYYSDRSCVRLGTQCWVGLGIVLTEILIWVKFGFLRPDAPWSAHTLVHILPIWGLSLMLFTFFCLYAATFLEKVPILKYWSEKLSSFPPCLKQRYSGPNDS